MPAANVLIRLEETAADVRYLREMAAIRDISVTALVRRLVETATAYKMIANILDDDAAPPVKRRGEQVGRPRTRPVTLPTVKLAGQPLGD